MSEDLLKGWSFKNKLRLKDKMEKLGIHQGGIFTTMDKNIALYNQLAKEV